MPSVALLDDPFFERHRAAYDHPEKPERLASVRRALEVDGVFDGQPRLSPREATDAELGWVHSESMIRQPKWSPQPQSER